MKDIIEIAQACRNACQSLVDTQPCSATFLNEGLGGMCAVASEFLLIKLKEYGIRGYFVKATCLTYGCSHCWNYVNGHIVDLTATQFGNSLPEVYTFKTGNKCEIPYFLKHWIDDHKITIINICTSRAMVRQSLYGWPSRDKLTNSYLSYLNNPKF